MLFSHERCPICGKGFKHAKCFNKQSEILNKKMSFVESICNRIDKFEGNDYTLHVFFQITAVTGELLYQKVHLPFEYLDFSINYVTGCSEIVYTKNICDPHFITDPTPSTMVKVPDKINFKKILDLDFPTLNKAINKAKVLAPFL